MIFGSKPVTLMVVHNVNNSQVETIYSDKKYYLEAYFGNYQFVFYSNPY